MTVLRSILFNVLWYPNLILQMIFFAPWYFTRSDRREAWKIPTNWGRTSNWLQEKIIGVRIEYEGMENIPPPGTGYIVAAKHQSVWEFYSLLPYLDDPAFVVKAELMKIPIFGQYINKVGVIPIVRAKRGEALRQMLVHARRAIDEGRQILIFPEGTRRSAGAEPDYRYGIVRMYEALDCPVLPVAHVSGLFWPRRRFRRYPGRLVVRFLPPIQPGLPPAEFHELLEETIESECDELYRLAASEPVHPPIPPAVQARLDEPAGEPVKG